MPDWRDDWQRFMHEIRGRLSRGDRLFGSRAFGYKPKRLMHEVSEELLDVCAWSYFLWAKIERLKTTLAPKRRRSKQRSRPKDKRKRL